MGWHMQYMCQNKTLYSNTNSSTTVKDNMEYLQHDKILTSTPYEPLILCLSCNKWSCGTYQNFWKEWNDVIRQRCYRESTYCQSTDTERHMWDSINCTINAECRAANSHALTVRLTHSTTFSRSHCDIESLTQFFFFVVVACQRFVMYKGYPYYVPAKSRQNFEVEKKRVPPPPRTSAFSADGPSHFSLHTLIQCWQPCECQTQKLWSCFNLIFYKYTKHISGE